MKFTVLGAGAIGSLYGGLLAHAAPEIEVLFVGRGAHGKSLVETKKLELEGPWGRHQIPVSATSRLEELAGSDVVLLSVKSHVTAEAIQAARPWLGDAVVVSIQNGINEDILSSLVDPQRLVVGMTTVNVAISEPGRVTMPLDGVTLLGPCSNGSQDIVGPIVALLRRTGLRVEVSKNMRGVCYNKLTMNVLGYASCLSQSNFVTEAMTYRPWRRFVGIPLVDECLATYHAAGIELAPIPGRPSPTRLRQILRLYSLPLIGSIASLATRYLYNRKPIEFSLYRDLMQGKQTEVDYINGEIVRLARSHGMDAPYNALMVDLAHRLEARGAGQFYSREDVLREFQRLRQSLRAR